MKFTINILTIAVIIFIMTSGTINCTEYEATCLEQYSIPPIIRDIDRNELEAISSQILLTQASSTGSGIKIGIISDGVKDIDDVILDGTLPENTHIISTGDGIEGIAMLEIVHNIAPDAELYFCAAGDEKAEFNRTVNALVDEGCQIICDDIGWIDEPFFEDGFVASHVREVIKENNILYISAAGNDAKRHYQGMFFDNGAGWHDFSSGTSNLEDIYVDIPPNEEITIVLQWNDSWSDSNNDYDLFLIDDDDGSALDSSEHIQNGTDGTNKPLEYIKYINKDNKTKNANIAIEKFRGQDKMLELYIYADSSVDIYPNNIVANDSIFGQSALPEVLCVGAINNDKTIANYSSRGAVSIYYPEQELRNKPDICSLGYANVSTYTDMYLVGTSASAPAVAGVAALAWSKYPEKDNEEIRDMLCESTEDLGEPGYDNVYGYGVINNMYI